MKLYFSPGACSLASHITLRELALPFQAVKVDLNTKKTETGADFNAINPKSQVPTLELDNGEVLTEGPAILQYLADQKPAAGLAPANGTFARTHLQEWLGFINSEVHKTYSPLFAPDTPEQTKQTCKEKLGKKFDFVQGALGDKPFLTGNQFTIADAYLYTVLGWAKPASIDLGRWPALQAYQARVASRPAVKAAHQAEAGK